MTNTFAARASAPSRVAAAAPIFDRVVNAVKSAIGSHKLVKLGAVPSRGATNAVLLFGNEFVMDLATIARLESALKPIDFNCRRLKGQAIEGDEVEAVVDMHGIYMSEDSDDVTGGTTVEVVTNAAAGSVMVLIGAY